MKTNILLCLCCLLWITQAQAQKHQERDSDSTAPGAMVLVPGGKYMPFFGAIRQKINQQQPNQQLSSSASERTEVEVKSFWIDSRAVTKAQYLAFVKSHPQWRRSKIASLYADSHYLASWNGDLKLPSKEDPRSPITEISWFAAQAYCQSRDASLPTVDQWEYAAADQGRGSQEAQKRILAWYSRPNSKSLPVVGSVGKNGFGVYDLHGLIWEWTLDFNSSMVSEESRENGTTDGNLFCGSGSVGALDATDYASFMRYSFRASLKASYTTVNLGFRCIKEASQ